MDNHIAFTYTIRTQSILRSGKALMQTFAKIRFAYSGGWSRSRRLCVMFLLPTKLAMPVQVFAACQQTSLPSTYITSWRSEEHTSELQLPCNLVCRLLLEK